MSALLRERDFGRDRLAAQALELGLLRGSREQQRGRGHRIGEAFVGNLARLVDVLEERKEGVVIALRDRIELVVVAPAAVEGEAEERRAERGHAVRDIGNPVLLLDDAALLVLVVQPVERRGESLLPVWIRQEVAGELPSGEFVETQVFVVGPDDPVAPGPHRAGAVHLVAVGVRETRDIQPVGGHPFAVARRGEQPVDDALVGAGQGVGEEGVGFRRRRRQARQIQRHPAQQALAIGLRGGMEFFSGEPTSDKTVDGRAAACPRFWLHDRTERPVRRPLGALLDPTLQQGDFSGRELADGIARWHHLLLIVAQDAEN
jgi:hypothetical protein